MILIGRNSQFKKSNRLKNKTAVLITVLVLFVLNSFGQSSYPTRDSTHIFWQPNLTITYQDYESKMPSQQLERMMDEYGFSASASVGIWSVLDIPKKKKDRYKKFEKVYFAPAFDKTTSYTKTNDPIQISMQNTYLDICEVWARWARQELSTMQDSMKGIGTLTIFYMTVKQEMEDKRKAMSKNYTRDVYIQKKPNAFQEWRLLIEKMLKEKVQWSTKPEECYRLMTKKPIEDDYIKAPTVVDVLKQ